MSRLLSGARWVALFLPAALAAQNVTTSGTVTVGAGGYFHDGDRPSLQRVTQQNKDGFGGIEEFTLTREAKESLFKFDARLLPGNDDYRVRLRYDRTERFYVEAGYEQFKVWYDGSGGYFRPTGTEFTLFDEDLSVNPGTL